MILLQKNFGDKKFLLVINSIIEEKVDAIVNPANESLAHGGGVAGLISRAGGPEIQQESNQKAPVKTGGATATTAGKLPYRAVIHTVGPIWRGGNHNEPELLKSAVLSALRTADDMNLSSVSMPSISTGIFGYPLEPAIRIIVDAIAEFLEKSRSVNEVHLCDFSPDKAEAIKRIVESHW